jgi:hypothetical protein
VAKIKHPEVPGSRRLEFTYDHKGGIEATAVYTAKYPRGQPYEVKELFRVIRHVVESTILGDRTGWVIYGFAFDDCIACDTLEEAKIVVQSLYEMQD